MPHDSATPPTNRPLTVVALLVATIAITKMNGSEMDERKIKVSEAQAKVPRDGSGSGRGHGETHIGQTPVRESDERRFPFRTDADT